MRLKVIVYHLLFWTAYISLNVFINKLQLFPPNFFLAEQVLKLVFPILFFYLTWSVILPLSHNDIIYRIYLLFISLLAHYIFRYLLLYHILPAISNYPKLTSEPFDKHFFAAGFWYWLHYTVYGWIYWYYFKSLRTERSLRMAEKQNYELQHEKLSAEFNYLKAQINPHFLYNTLNFFYTSTRNNNPKTAEGIAILADLMKYSLDKNTKNGKVLLENEWEQVKNFILLHQLRFEEKLPVQINCRDNLENITILPHLLITLVENAFKHGDIKKEIIIDLEITTGSLHFFVKNYKKETKPTSADAGVGLQNIRARLIHEYGNKAILNTTLTGSVFFAKLKIPL
jgi:two-component system, LytTR family, sensor kinase